MRKLFYNGGRKSFYEVKVKMGIMYRIDMYVFLINWLEFFFYYCILFFYLIMIKKVIF